MPADKAARAVVGLLFVGLFGAVAAGPVEFSGSVSLTGDQSFITGDDSLTSPVSDLNFSINPTLTLWGVPIALDALIGSQETGLRQQFNQFRVYLDPQAWARRLAGASGLAQVFQAVEIGTCHPSYSGLTLAGEPVLGAAVELNPGNFYVAGTGGRSRRAVEHSDTTEAAYRRMLYAGRLGFGKKQGTHFFLTGLFAQDDPNSIADAAMPYDTTIFEGDTLIDSTDVVSPEENYLVGAEFNLNLFEGGFTLESEVAVSEHTRDNRLEVEDFEAVPDWLEGMFKPRLSSSIDYAWSARPAVNVLDTRVYAEVEFIGPGYRSLGATSLRNDNLAFGGGISRDFLDRQLSVGASFRRERDNNLSSRDSTGGEIQLREGTTVFMTYTFDVGLYFAGAPYLQVGYAPYTETGDSLAVRADIVSIGAGYDFATGAITHTPGLSFSYQGTRGEGIDGNTSFDVGLDHSLGFEFPLTVTFGLGLAQTSGADTAAASRSVYLDLSPSYTLFNEWTNTLSLGGSFDSDGSRFDVRLNSVFPVWRICAGQAGVEHVSYGGDDGSYQEWRLRAGLSRTW